jgi:uncharacterized protein YjbJ (UPF0337 family)
MNKDQIKGSAREMAGKVQKHAGKATGSAEHEVKGAVKEAAGKAQKAYGDARNDREERNRH